jgi:hypothetical protein
MSDGRRLLASVDDTPLENVRPYDIHKLANSFNLRKDYRLHGIPNECLRHLPRRPLAHPTYLFNHCLRFSHFPKTLKENFFLTLLKSAKDPKFPQDLGPISVLFTVGKLFQKVILKIVEGTLKKEVCLMQACLVSVPVTA